MSHIMDASGKILTNRQDIEHGFLDFHTNLWNNSSKRNFSNVLNAFPNDLYSISSSDSDFLTQEVSKNEIFQTLISLSSG